MTTGTAAPTSSTRRVFGRCVSCKRRWVLQDVTMIPVCGRSPQPSDADYERMFVIEHGEPCPKSGHDVNPVNTTAHMITWNFGPTAKLAPSVTCSAKCHESLSPTCKCSCGGAEHGSLA